MFRGSRLRGRPFRHLKSQRAATWGERGVALVEAAIITPIFMMLVFGIIEGGLFMNTYLGVSSSVRAGARSASAYGADGNADLFTVLNVSKESSALDDQDIKYIVIYKATAFGAKPNTTCAGGTSQSGVCNVYRAADIAKAIDQVAEMSDYEADLANGQPRPLDQSKIWFGCLTSGPHSGQSPDRFWCPTSRVDTRNGNNRAGPDYVGVYIQATHRWVTKMFGNTATIRDQSVIQIEPRAV